MIKMIIISKFKDYYDYLQGILGRDEKIVLDRTSSDSNVSHYSQIEKAQKSTLLKVIVVIGSKKFEYFLFKDKAYTIDELEKEGIIKHGSYTYSSERFKNYFSYEFISRSGRKKSTTVGVSESDEYIRDDREEKSGFIFAKVYNVTGFDEKDISRVDYLLDFPSLQNLKLQKILSPLEVWNLIYNELCKKLDGVETRELEDKEKIVNKGFDLKTSFRNIK